MSTGVRHVAAIPCLALLAGSAVGLLLPDPPTLIAAVSLTAAAVSTFWCWRAGNTRLFVAFAGVAFFSGAVLLAAVAWQRAWRPPLRAIFDQAAQRDRRQAAVESRRVPLDDEAALVIEGTLAADASTGENGVALMVDVERAGGERTEGAEILGRVSVSVVGGMAAEHVGEWRAGRRLRMPAQLRRASRYLDPGVPDHERALARRGITLVGTVKSASLVEVLGRGGRWDEWLASARAVSRRIVAQYVGRWNQQSAAIVSAIVIGDRSALDPGVQRRLQEAGTYHVIAISGGNIAILAGLMIGAFRIAGVLGRSAMIAAIAVLIVYAQFVGGGASVDRATLMGVVYFGARALDHRSPPLNALAVVAAILVGTNPLAVADPAFLLTCGATLAILTIAPAVDLRALPRGTRTAASMLMASFAAELLLLPVGATLFERVTLAGLGLNFVAIPLMGIAQVAGMALIPAAMVSSSLATATGWIAHVSAAGLIWSANLVRCVPALAWRVAAPSPAACIIYYAALALVWFWRPARRVAAAVAMGAALWIAIDPHTIAARRGDGRLHVTFLDVGQGDSILVVFPRGSTLLVDAGGLSASASFDIGDRVVAPVLRHAGFRRLDHLAVTHGDNDHAGGAASLVAEFRPRDVWEGIPVPKLELLTQLRATAAEQHSDWANLYTPYRVSIDDVQVMTWHPQLEEWERQKVRNDDSLVLELRWRDVSIILTGDIGGAVEKELADRMEPAPLRVVKVPHHGSLTSSTDDFVKATQPRLAVVSVGRNNRFGHPAPEVLRRYDAVGATVFRTDRDGAVFVDSDGYSLDVHSFVEPAVQHETTKAARSRFPGG